MTTDFFYTNFNHMWDTFTTGGGWKGVNPEKTCRLPSSPPCDCSLSSDLNSLTLVFALAGYEKKDIEVSASTNSITLKTAKAKIGTHENVLHNGISKKAHNITLSIDDSFDPKKADVQFINGVLKVVIPKTEEGKSVKLL